MESIKLIRQNRNWKQLDLALAAGTSKARIAEVEGGSQPPSINFLKDIARPLRVELWQIFYLEEHQELLNEKGVEQILTMTFSLANNSD